MYSLEAGGMFTACTSFAQYKDTMLYSKLQFGYKHKNRLFICAN